MNYSIRNNIIRGSAVLAAFVAFVFVASPSFADASITVTNNDASKTYTFSINKTSGPLIDYTVNKTNTGLHIDVTKNVYPTVAYDYGYNYDYNYNSYGCDYSCGYNYPTYQPLQVSCYPQPLTINAGDSATWVSNVYGGTGSYSYSWSGSDGLSGAGSSISKTYYNSGPKSASLTVTSGSQTRSISCSGTVNVYGTYNYPVYNPPVYYPQTYYQPLQVSCTPNISYTSVGAAVTWSASVVGGYNSGYYSSPTYSWSGSDGLYGYGQTIAMTYNTPGYKTASVTVTANGQTVTQACSTSVNVTGGYGYPYPTGSYPTGSNDSGLNIGCYSDPASASINQPVTWAVEVTGGVGPYTYSWSGTDNLSGSAASVIKYYNSYGEKSAVVSVTSADGRTGTRACSNSLNIRRAGGTYTAPTQTAPATSSQQSNLNNQSAAALFSLQNIPWGWVAILIILVLFATIMYLIFNRPKI